MHVKVSQMNVTSFDLSKAVTFSKFFSKIALSPTGRLVIRCLVDFYNPKKGLVYPGQKVIAECTGAAEKSITNAIEELRKNNLIITSKKGTHLNYHFTKKFFELVGITDNERKIYGSETVKFTDTCHEQKKENKLNNKKENKILNFEKIQGAKYLSADETKRMIDQTRNVERKSPYDDIETALKWLSELSEKDLRHSFIRERVEKVKRIWNL